MSEVMVCEPVDGKAGWIVMSSSHEMKDALEYQ